MVGYTRNSQIQQEGNESPLKIRQKIVNTDVNVQQKIKLMDIIGGYKLR